MTMWERIQDLIASAVDRGRPIAGRGCTVTQDAHGRRIDVTPPQVTSGQIGTPVLITGTMVIGDSGAYAARGDVYGNGTGEAATETDVPIYLPWQIGMDADGAGGSTQAFVMATETSLGWCLAWKYDDVWVAITRQNPALQYVTATRTLALTIFYGANSFVQTSLVVPPSSNGIISLQLSARTLWLRASVTADDEVGVGQIHTDANGRCLTLLSWTWPPMLKPRGYTGIAAVGDATWRLIDGIVVSTSA